MDKTIAPVKPITSPKISRPLGNIINLKASITVKRIVFKLTRDIAGPIGPLEQALAIKASPIVFRALPMLPISRF